VRRLLVVAMAMERLQVCGGAASRQDDGLWEDDDARSTQKGGTQLSRSEHDQLEVIPTTRGEVPLEADVSPPYVLASVRVADNNVGRRLRWDL